MDFKGTHILSTDQFEKKDLELVLDISKKMEEGLRGNVSTIRNLLSGYILSTLFYESSTRTRFSFEAAMLRLGGQVMSSPDMVSFSSVSKGETLYDTAKVVSLYCDVIAIRHGKELSVSEFSKGSEVPVMNAGDGPAEHPTQALLDLYTIQRFKGRIDDLHITMVGDLKFGRTVHSLIKLLRNSTNINFTFISPEGLELPSDLSSEIEKYNETKDLIKGIKDADVIYVTRAQKERFGKEEKGLEKEPAYIIDKEVMKSVKKDAVIMHPLPRREEIAVEIDSDPRSIYFEQARNGLYVRMALLSLCLGKEG